MFVIIAYHYVVHGGFEFTYVSTNKIFLECFSMLGKLGVNLFVLITGYFDIKSNLKISKVIKLWLQTFWFSIACFCFGVINGSTPFSFSLLVHSILPVTFNSYWFITAYIVLYLFEPFLNKLLLNLKKEEFERLLGLIIFIGCIIPTCLLQLTAFNWTQQTWMFAVYIMGAYIRLYPNKYFNNQNINKKLIIVTLVFLYSSPVILNILGGISPFFATKTTYFRWSNTIPVFVASISIFCFFKNMNIGSIGWINWIASASFSVYLLHENIIFRPWLWETFLHQRTFQEKGILVIHAFVSIFIVYLMGLGIHIFYSWGYKAGINKIETHLEKRIKNIVCKISKIKNLNCYE